MPHRKELDNLEDFASQLVLALRDLADVETPSSEWHLPGSLPSPKGGADHVRSVPDLRHVRNDPASKSKHYDSEISATVTSKPPDLEPAVEVRNDEVQDLRQLSVPELEMRPTKTEASWTVHRPSWKSRDGETVCQLREACAPDLSMAMDEVSLLPEPPTVEPDRIQSRKALTSSCRTSSKGAAPCNISKQSSRTTSKECRGPESRNVSKETSPDAVTLVCHKSPVPEEDLTIEELAGDVHNDSGIHVVKAGRAAASGGACGQPPDTGQHSSEEMASLRLQLLQLRRLCESQTADIAKQSSQLAQSEAEIERLKRHSYKDAPQLEAESQLLKRRSSAPVGNQKPEGTTQLQEELVRLKTELHDKGWECKRLEASQEKELEGFTLFTSGLIQSSCKPTLSELCDFGTIRFLGMGNYGFVFICKEKASDKLVVVKLQSTRWMAVCVQEWMHGRQMCKTPAIVQYIKVLAHRDVDGSMRKALAAGFDDGSLSGKRPKSFPETYICMVLEYMNQGTVQHLSNEKLISLEGLAAITHQVAVALAHMHGDKRTHNDIKPENILLNQADDADHLEVKLADLGLAQHSVERDRDYDLFAYTIWCLGLGKKFEKLPSKDDRASAAAEFKKEAVHGDSRNELRLALAEVVSGLWTREMSMMQIEHLPVLQKAVLRIASHHKSSLETHATLEVGRTATRSHAAFQRAAGKLKILHCLTGHRSASFQGSPAVAVSASDAED